MNRPIFIPTSRCLSGREGSRGATRTPPALCTSGLRKVLPIAQHVTKYFPIDRRTIITQPTCYTTISQHVPVSLSGYLTVLRKQSYRDSEDVAPSSDVYFQPAKAGMFLKRPENKYPKRTSTSKRHVAITTQAPSRVVSRRCSWAMHGCASRARASPGSCAGTSCTWCEVWLTSKLARDDTLSSSRKIVCCEEDSFVFFLSLLLDLASAQPSPCLGDALAASVCFWRLHQLTAVFQVSHIPKDYKMELIVIQDHHQRFEEQATNIGTSTCKLLVSSDAFLAYCSLLSKLPLGRIFSGFVT